MALHDPCVDGSGVIQGMDEAALDVYSRYVVPVQGIYGVGATVIPTIPWPEWSWWTFLEQGTVTLEAAQGTAETFHTVPDNERHKLLGIHIIRNSGDNLYKTIRIRFPNPYSSGLFAAAMITITTAAVNISYPSPASIDVDSEIWSGPFIMEPGTLVQVGPSGAGASETIGAFHLLLEKTRLIRAREPAGS